MGQLFLSIFPDFSFFAKFFVFVVIALVSDRLGKGGPYKSFTHCEGHNVNGVVTHARWNEVYQKLATSDDSGLIIVWMNHQSEDAWFEVTILVIFLTFLGDDQQQGQVERG